jgi:hypothetical protein
MPYKHIAAHLKKTELACRLHYHQLSHGSHRRKRAASVSSHNSAGSAGQSPSMGQYSHAEHEEYNVNMSRQCSPISYGSQSPPQHSSVHSSPNRTQHKILLPKPRPLSPNESPEPPRLRLNTNDMMHHQNSVDTDRLRSIYEARRTSFWASIAAEYGNDVTPAQLEDIWRTGPSIGARPPTPDPSPDGSISGYPSYPTLKPSPFAYPTQVVHSRSAATPERMAYVLPNPNPVGRLSRSSTWSSSSNVPIAALLTEDKNPRGEEVA